MIIRILILLWLLGMLLPVSAQDYEGTFLMQLQTDNGKVPYEIQLVTAEDGAVFGGISALSDTLYYEMPLQLTRQAGCTVSRWKLCPY